jgi:hypothetical protein
VRALVPALVLLAIVALVWPRGTAEPQGAAPVETTGVAPSTLVDRALEQLYAAPAGLGGAVWQARYAMRWYFGDESFADLEGTLWLDPEGGRHRMQLVHEAGGGPFELQLGDGRDTLWYAVEPRYAASIYPQIEGRFSPRVRLELAREEQQEMLAARLGAGAWALPADYLRQASEADDLRSWGRRSAEDGAELAVISFQGRSALAPPNGTEDDDITVLLSIDIGSGSLYEVRELVGPDAGEQTGRTVWRFLGGERLPRGQESEAAFDLRQAVRARDSYALVPGGPAMPELPMIPASATLPLARGLDALGPPLLAPRDAPPGMTSGALISAEGRTIDGATLLYLGEGRRLAIRALPLLTVTDTALSLRLPRAEVVALDDGAALPEATVRMQPGPARRYDMALDAVSPATGSRFQALISAQGFSREELLALLPTVAPLSLEAVRRQSALFVGAQYRDREAFDALLAALAEVSPPDQGQVRYTMERSYARQALVADTLRDPYHLPPYEGRPETLVTETWVRSSSDGVETATVVRGEDGTVFERGYTGPSGGWTQNLARGEVMVYPASRGAAPRAPAEVTARQLLVCGAVMVEAGGGKRALMLSETGWRRESCALPGYIGRDQVQSTLMFQRSDGGVVYTYQTAVAGGESTPFLADLPNGDLTLVAWPGANRRLARTEVQLARSGTAPAAMVERWELVREELLPAGRVPPDVFRRAVPPAFVRIRAGSAERAAIQLVDIDRTQARALLGGAVFDIGPVAADGEPQASLARIALSTYDADGFYGEYIAADNPFEGALYHGVALRFEYALGGRGVGPGLRLYQGRADRFGRYLRSRARWMSSAPLTMEVGGRELQGWRVTTFDGREWALVESEGVLLALPLSDPQSDELFRRLVEV